MPSAIAHKYHDEIADVGFTVIRQFLTPEEIAKYKEASATVVEYAREGKWPYVRTRGKQFPPWPKNFSPDIWGVSGLLHPDLGGMSDPFHECYSSDKMLAVVSDILQVDKKGLSMELFNMLINPLSNFGLDWHRDTIKPEATEEEEAEQLLHEPYAGAQFNLALTEDSCLIVVPGSHKRVRTAEERIKTSNDDRKEYITNQLVVELHPGDLVFYNNNILHRAEYCCENTRLTLHGSYGHTDHGRSRAKGILQHGVAEWLPRFQPKDKNMESLKDNLVRLAKEFESVDLGYALEG
ncbi:uncharacterized protein RJT20DRAFT_36902 [Scheffersomyces xylosifermentans]|uniref:uncharacterized protein n=1 Tax=Scheffersomyces xylosifermentans TaxID=1304137 RepID=UPI00315D6490